MLGAHIIREFASIVTVAGVSISRLQATPDWLLLGRIIAGMAGRAIASKNVSCKVIYLNHQPKKKKHECSLASGDGSLIGHALLTPYGTVEP